MSNSPLDLTTIYLAAKVRDTWDEAETTEPGRALVRQYDEAVGTAVEDLGRALEDGDLGAVTAAHRGLRAVSDAFGAAEWVVQQDHP